MQEVPCESEGRIGNRAASFATFRKDVDFRRRCSNAVRRLPPVRLQKEKEKKQRCWPGRRRESKPDS